jgi:hypothetical protein
LDYGIEINQLSGNLRTSHSARPAMKVSDQPHTGHFGHPLDTMFLPVHVPFFTVRGGGLSANRRKQCLELQ